MKLRLYFVFISLSANCQPNCQIYTDSNCIRACELSIIAEAGQWYKECQEVFDEAINLCPKNVYSWREKAVPYLKTGDFITWKKLIDKTVEYDPKGSLAYRGWCRLQFFRDYSGAINDFEMLERMVNYDIGYAQNGDYHLIIAKAMCYSALGNYKKAIEIMQKQLNISSYEPGFYDFYQLGCIYLSNKNIIKAKECFDKQTMVYEFAENLYQKAKIARQERNIKVYKKLRQMAINMYSTTKTMRDPYTQHLNKVYLETIKSL